MSQISVGNQPGGASTTNENQPPSREPGAASSKTLGEYGKEGTNKTIPVPKPDGMPSEELGHTDVKHVEKSPYTRG